MRLTRFFETILGSRAAIALGAVAGLLCSSNAAAFRLIEAQPVDGTYCAGTPVACGADTIVTRWFNNPVPFWVNEDAAADAADAGLSQADIIDAAQASYQAWEDVPFSIIKFVYVGETSARLADDGINSTLWYDSTQDFGTCAGVLGTPDGVLAVTVLTEVALTGEITDADVIFDSADTWEWNTSCTNLDVQSTLTHEYGHSIGIHHTELPAGSMATRPTMYAYEFCDAGVASGRTLEPDDEGAAQCLYPENPTLVTLDQTGSMSIGSRMADAQESANAFVTDLATNIMAVSAFAAGACGRDGYEQLEDWTDVVADLQFAVNSTSACGNTPMWESACCALGKAVELSPSSVLLITDTDENSSDAVCSADCPAGYCGCLDEGDVAGMYDGTDVALYIIDITDYYGTGSLSVLAGDESKRQENELRCNEDPGTSDGRKLSKLAALTGGLYCNARHPGELTTARIAIERHMAQHAKARQNPPTCRPELPIDDIQVYPGGRPYSPYEGREVRIGGRVTATRKTFDLGTVYVEDCSGGIWVYDTAGPSVSIGDRVEVSGVVQDFLGEYRIQPVSSFKLLGQDRPVLSPIIDPPTARDFELVGSQLSVRGYVPGKVDNYRFQLTAALESDSRLTVRIDPDTGIEPDSIVPGQEYLVTGILTVRRGALELLPRGDADIIHDPSTRAPKLGAPLR